MPKLGNSDVTRLNLPSTAGSADPGWVDIKNNLTLGDALEASKEGLSASDITLETLASAITAWNMTDEDSVALDTTPANIKKLGIQDSSFLLNWIKEHYSTEGLSTTENLV